MSRRIEYRIDLDERGEFKATIYEAGDCVLAEVDTEDLSFMVEHQGVRHARDYHGLREYLLAINVLDESDTFEICG